MGGGVELVEQLRDQHDQIDLRCDRRDQRQLGEGAVADVVMRFAADEPQEQDHERWSRGERRRQEARPEQGGIPEWPGRQPGQQEGGHHVDAHRPHHGDVHPGEVPSLVRRAARVAAVEDVKRDDQVQRQVAVEHYDIPCQ